MAGPLFPRPCVAHEELLGAPFWSVSQASLVCGTCGQGHIFIAPSLLSQSGHAYIS